MGRKLPDIYSVKVTAEKEVLAAWRIVRGDKVNKDNDARSEVEVRWAIKKVNAGSTVYMRVYKDDSQDEDTTMYYDDTAYKDMPVLTLPHLMQRIKGLTKVTTQDKVDKLLGDDP